MNSLVDGNVGGGVSQVLFARMGRSVRKVKLNIDRKGASYFLASLPSRPRLIYCAHCYRNRYPFRTKCISTVFIYANENYVLRGVKALRREKIYNVVQRARFLIPLKGITSLVSKRATEPKEICLLKTFAIVLVATIIFDRIGKTLAK